MISILIPTHNDCCVSLVIALSQQAATLKLEEWEVVVADDASTDSQSMSSNQTIDAMPHCRLIVLKNNIGRAGIRNLLASQAKGEWLLFIDADLTVIDKHYLERYVSFARQHHAECVCCGGYKALSGPSGNLRWVYEQNTASAQLCKQRQRHEYQSFKLSNTLLSKSIFLRCRLDENLKHYGYEDVMLGIQLEKSGIPVYHIDNPVGFCHYESNASYLAKLDEAADTLCRHRHDMQGYSRLLTLAVRLRKSSVSWLWISLCRHIVPLCRRNLLSDKPIFIMLRLYQLGNLMLNPNW